MLRVVLVLIAGCHKAPAAPAADPPPTDLGPRAVDDGGDLRGAAGVRATVTGTLERLRPALSAADGTALVLTDGTAIYVTEGDPPVGWEWLLGSRVRVQGTLWAEAGALPKLLDPEAPMPADMGMTP